MRDILIATRNKGKVAELRAALAAIGMRVHTLDELPIPTIEETGATFEENARLKALTASRQTDWLVLADDSGLEVDAIGGEPGVHSARFGGPNGTDRSRCLLLLSKLEGRVWDERTARFVCSVVLAQKGRVVQSFRGVVEGMIAFEPRGASGFGYDPIFYHPPAAKTFGEMTLEEKARVSHRGRAIDDCIHYLDRFEA